MKVFVLPGSLRRESLNRKLGAAAAAAASAIDGVAAEVMPLSECDIPHYNADLEEASGFPEGVLCIARRMTAADGVIVASPEYNGSFPGVLKNALDWLSRPDPDPFEGKPFLLMAASPGRHGGKRVLEQLASLLGERLGAKVHPESFSLPRAGESFDGSGRLIAAEPARELARVVREFVAAIKGGG